MLRFVSTSILDSKAQTVVNTVNTVGVMGKGLAHAFRERHPKMFRSYKDICDRGLLDIGKLWLWRGDVQWVLNFPTKKHWKYPSKIEYIEAGLNKFVAQYESQGIREISFPRLGCGNGGLEWNEVRPVMEHHLKRLPISIYIHDFDADIGAPEHQLALRSHSYRRSFDALLEDLRAICLQNSGRFKTVFSQSEFTARVLEDGAISIGRAGRTKEVQIPADDLYEAWFMLIHGPLNESKLVGKARDESSYLLGLLASLPYARAIQLRNVDSTTPSTAVELSDDLTEEQVLDINETA